MRLVLRKAPEGASVAEAAAAAERASGLPPRRPRTALQRRPQGLEGRCGGGAAALEPSES